MYAACCSFSFDSVVQLYVENLFARSVLMKPVQQEVEMLRWKMVSVSLASILLCVDCV